MSLGLWGSDARAEPSPGPVGIDEVVAAALAQPELSRVLASDVMLEEAMGTERSTWPNPVVTFDREAVSVDGHEELEQTVTLSQAIEISGRRGLRSDAASEMGRARALEGEASLRQTAMETRRRFWRVVLLQEQHHIVHRWLQRIEEASQRVSQQRALGETATYDVLRVGRELRASNAALARTHADREVAWLRLEELTGALHAPEGWPRARGSLLPLRPSMTVVEATRPDVRAWQARERAAELELRAAERGWIPQIGLTAGWRRAQDRATSGTGVIAGVGLSIPVFDRGQRHEATARAKAARARSIGELMANNARRQQRSARARTRELISLAVQLRAGTDEASQELEATAEAAWVGGELNLLEILDVHRGLRDDALSVLELEHEARTAREDLRALMLEEHP